MIHRQLKLIVPTAGLRLSLGIGALFLTPLLGCVSSAQTPTGTAAGTASSETKLVALKPGYSLGDDARDPFYETRKATVAKPQGPTAETLVDFVAREGLVKGLLGKPENPDKAGVLIGTKIYRINDFIPVKYNNTVYSLVLVAVKFPGVIHLKYQDQVVPMSLKQNKPKGNQP